MTFIARLFGKGQTSSSGSIKGSIGTSIAPTTKQCTMHLEEESDREESSRAPPLRNLSHTVAPCARRSAVDLTRSKLATCVTRSDRCSESSCDDMADPLNSAFRHIKNVHRGRVVNVLRAVDRSSKASVVLKAYTKARLTATWLDRLQRERLMLEEVKGIPGVAQLVRTLEDAECQYLVQECSPGCTLIETVCTHPGRFPESAAALEVFVPLLRTLSALHARGIVHRALKPEHIMCAPGRVVLVDFSDAVDQNVRMLNARAGSLEYCAPEVLNKPTLEEIFHKVLYNGMSEEELPRYDEKADIWSLGVVVYEALTGCQPFFADTVADMTAAHASAFARASAVTGMPDFIAKQGLSVAAQRFLQRMLQPDPALRPSAQELLSDKWLDASMHLPSDTEYRRSFSCNDADARAPLSAPLSADATVPAAGAVTVGSTSLLRGNAHVVRVSANGLPSSAALW